MSRILPKKDVHHCKRPAQAKIGLFLFGLGRVLMVHKVSCDLLYIIIGQHWIMAFLFLYFMETPHFPYSFLHMANGLLSPHVNCIGFTGTQLDKRYPLSKTWRYGHCCWRYIWTLKIVRGLFLLNENIFWRMLLKLFIFYKFKNFIFDYEIQMPPTISFIIASILKAITIWLKSYDVTQCKAKSRFLLTVVVYCHL